MKSSEDISRQSLSMQSEQSADIKSKQPSKEKKRYKPEMKQEKIIYPKGAKKNPSDYCVTYSRGSVKIGFCQLKNECSIQGEFLSAETEGVIELSKLSKINQGFALKGTFNNIQTTVVGREEHQGSTCCVATAWLDNGVINTVTAHVGDSMAYLFVFNDENKCVLNYQLNTLHTPNDKKERGRIKKAGGEIKNKLLEGELPMSRALGFTYYDKRGLSHIPAITSFDHKLIHGHRGILLVGSNGLSHVLPIMAKVIEACLDEGITYPAYIANYVAINTPKDCKVLERGNTSCAVTFIGPQPVSLLVCKNHSDTVVSDKPNEVGEKVSQRFFHVLPTYVKPLKKSMVMIQNNSSEPIQTQGLFAAKPQDKSKVKKEGHTSEVKEERRRLCSIL